MAEQHICSRDDAWVDIRSRVGRLEINDREDYGSKQQLAQALVSIGDTLVKVNKNLDNLNEKNEKTNLKVDAFKKEIDCKINNLESQISTQHEEDISDRNQIVVDTIKRNSIDLSPLREKIFYGIIGCGIIYIIGDKTGIIAKIFGF